MFPPVVSCLPWGCLCLVGPGARVVCCGRCLLLARALLAAGAAASAAPTSLRCLFGGAVQFKVYTLLLSLEEFSAIPPSKPQRVIMRWSFNLWCRHGKNCEIKFPFFSTSGLAFIKGPCEAGWVVGQRCQVLGWQKPEDNAEKH